MMKQKMDTQQFIVDNNIAILVEANIGARSFNIVKGNIELQSKDLFDQLILYGSVDKLCDSIKNRNLL